MEMRRRQQDELLAAGESGKVCMREGGEAKMHYAHVHAQTLFDDVRAAWAAGQLMSQA